MRLILFLLLASVLPLIFASEESFSLPLIPHHQQRARRGLQHADLSPLSRNRHRLLQGQDTLTIGALYQGYGTHYVDLWVGSPIPQRQTVIVDTGSGVTAFPCSGCKDCGKEYHIDEFFQEENSTTFSKLPCDECTRGSCSNKECRIGMSYQEGSSWSAYEGQDVTYAGGPHDEPLQPKQDNGGTDIDPLHASAYAFPLTFGCQTKITGLFKTQLADGIMGMDNAATSYWYQMNNKDKLKKKRFALCYSRQPTSTREGTEAGALTFGKPDTRLHSSPMVYTGGKKGRVGFFSVRIRKVYLRAGGGGDSATSSNKNVLVNQLGVSEDTLNRGGIIVDSGTTDTYFTKGIASAFSNEFEKLTGTKYGHAPVDLTSEQLNAMPTILLQIVGDEDSNKGLFGDDYVTGLAGKDVSDAQHPYDVILAIPPSHYMEYDHKKEKYIARFYTDEGSGSVLGGNAIMGHDVYFDMENNRIGWAESKCDYTELITKYDTGASHSEPKEPEIPATSEKEAIDEPSGLPDTNNPTASNDSSQFCSDATCRFSFLAAALGVAIVGMFIGRAVSKRRRGAVRYHGTELEVPTLRLDEDDVVDFTTRYHDDPDDNNVAEEGTGYQDGDEFSHEIA